MHRKKHALVLLLVVVVVDLILVDGLSGSRSILRAHLEEKEKSQTPPGDYALEINSTNFDSVLKDTPASYAVVEFFAHWCPACRNYKPHYEKVARLFNGPDAVHPGTVLMARVDCALKINSKLCDKFSVSHYPMLFWGPPSKFALSRWDPKDEKSEIRLIDDGRTAERLLNWINKQLGSSYGLDDENFENELLPANIISDPVQVARAVYDVEEATATAFDIILEHKMIRPGTRASLIKFFQLIVAHHPSRRCRKGSAEILVNFNDLYPPVISSPNKDEVAVDSNGFLGNFQICGKEVPRGYWMFCRGSKNDTRGFSCGLWVLLHSISVRLEDGEAQFAFTSTCDFIRDFFICEECRRHFYDMCSSVESPFNTSRQFVLWLWSAHNKVNDRLMEEEASLETGDPKFPKIIWPPKQLCSSCHLPLNQRENKSMLSDIFRGSSQNNQTDWDLDEVYKFLTSYYGDTLVSLYKDDDLGNEVRYRTMEELVASTNAVMLPLGAALAIAFASCAFGGLACYWRSQQKSRKPRRKLDV